MADPGSATRGALLREGGGGDPLTVRFTCDRALPAQFDALSRRRAVVPKLILADFDCL